ncbi:hypothetical protein ACFY78_07140 [Streptomyces olindensis]|uniref:hypothetical protein n=1 Tax=Streptomyces olindensis TaxID=358823 RepID=UPI0036A27E5A
MKNPYLAQLGPNGVRQLRSYSTQGKQRLADIEAAIRRALGDIPSNSQLPREAELALRLYAAELWNGKTFHKAREWIGRVDHYAGGYSVLSPVKEAPSAPAQDLFSMTDVGAAHQVNDFLDGFRSSVSSRVQAIDALLNGNPPSAATLSVTLPPLQPAPSPPVGPSAGSSQAGPSPSSGEHPSIQEGKTGISATVLNVLIASPGDTEKERKIAEEVIREWNSDHAQELRVILMPQMWESDTYARMGGGGQEQVNIQIADRSDIVIGLFRARLGQATQNYPSGAAEEIERAIARDAPVHVYVSKMPLLVDEINPAELARLRTYTDDLRSRGLLGSYKSSRDLRRKLRKALEHDVAYFLKRSRT